MKAVKVLLALSLVAVLSLPGLALADGVFIPDTTLVDPYRWNAESTYPGWTTWTDIIGTPTADWDLKGVNIAYTADKVQMTIYTNYAQAGIDGAGQADIALGKNGNFNLGIKMSGTGLGDIYSVTSWTKPGDNPPLAWSDGNWIYSGKYDQGAPKDPLSVDCRRDGHRQSHTLPGTRGVPPQLMPSMWNLTAVSWETISTSNWEMAPAPTTGWPARPASSPHSPLSSPDGQRLAGPGPAGPPEGYPSLKPEKTASLKSPRLTRGGFFSPNR